MSVVDNRVHCLSLIVILKKVLISDYGVLRVQKRCVFFAFFQNGSKDFTNFMQDGYGQ